MKIKHKKIKKKHPFKRETLKLMVEAWKHYIKAGELFDQAILRELLSHRNKRKNNGGGKDD